MNRFATIFTLVLLALATLAWARSAQSDEKDTITAVAQSYMDAYYTADPARMERTLHPDFHKRTLQTIDGQLKMTEDTVESMLEGTRGGTGTTIPIGQRVQKIEVLDVYKNAASVKVVTGLWIDYMHLSRFNGEWRVLDVVLQYTKR